MGLSLQLQVLFGIIWIVVPMIHGYCDDWEARMDQDVFYKCLRRLSESDRNGDDAMNRHEFAGFLKKFAWSLYVVPPFSNGTVPGLTDMAGLFESLVVATGDRIDQDGNPTIDIWGSDMEEGFMDSERLEALHHVCDKVVEGMYLYTTKVVAKKKLTLLTVNPSPSN
jgi:hypothetical protein